MSERTNPTLSLSVWGLLLVVMGGILVAYTWRLSRVVSSGPPLPVLGEVGSFQLTNEQGRAVSEQELRGKVWVADIIFTRCPGPCAQMTRAMAELQALLPDRPELRLVSLTTDPDFDTPEVLRDYARRAGADPARWQFLTGTKRELGRLAVEGLRLTAIDKAEELRATPEDLFIHSSVFVLVDRAGRLRGVFETTGPDVSWPEQREELRQAIERLLDEG